MDLKVNVAPILSFNIDTLTALVRSLTGEGRGRILSSKILYPVYPSQTMCFSTIAVAYGWLFTNKKETSVYDNVMLNVYVNWRNNMC